MMIDRNGRILDAWWYSDGPMAVVNEGGQEIHIAIPYDAEQKKERVKIDDLKKKLEASDYWTNKYLEGEYTEEEWEARKAQRIEWRARLRELQADFVEPTITQDEIRTAIDLAEQNLKKIIERETGKEVEEISLGEET